MIGLAGENLWSNAIFQQAAMEETFAKICFSNAAFLWVKRVFFQRWLFLSIATGLAIGLPLSLAGVPFEQIPLLLVGFVFSLPFVAWAILLVAVCFVLGIPRLLVLGLFVVCALHLVPGWLPLGAWLSKLASKYDRRYGEPNSQISPFDHAVTTDWKAKADGVR